MSPSEAAFEIEIDRNGDGIADAKVKTLQTGDVGGPGRPEETGDPTDVHVSFTSASAPAFNAGTYRYLNVDPATRDTNLFASNVVVIPAPGGDGRPRAVGRECPLPVPRRPRPSTYLGQRGRDRRG